MLIHDIKFSKNMILTNMLHLTLLFPYVGTRTEASDLVLVGVSQDALEADSGELYSVFQNCLRICAWLDLDISHPSAWRWK